MARRRTPRVSVIRLTTGHTARTLHHPYSWEPMLTLDFGATSLLITTAGPATSRDVEFARQLAREAIRFARTLERTFHALPHDQRTAA
ncbi:hypothetical protein [Nonomuraea indica]|uniref:Uncharacterized protein n=1 Tax=Nonomuraea indica TaxID=1581193 RepID=A0ABW7ZY25_9ACTN